MLTGIARRAAIEFADVDAFVTEHGWSITYAELDRAADEVAAGLADHGIGSGDVVVLATPSNVDYVVVYLAAARLGAITAGLNPRFTGAELRACLAVLDPDLVVASPPLAEAMGPIDHPIAVVQPGTDAASVAARFRVRGAPPAPDLDPDPERPVCICFTSGSTGQPRGGWYAERQLQAIADLDTGGAWGGGGHGLSSVQMAHVGFMTKLPWMLASGRTTHLLERWSARPILDLIVEHEMPAVTGLAPQIALLLALPDIGGHDFDHVRAIVVGGAASPPALVEEARRVFGAPYSIRYSSTESGGIGLGTALDADDDETLHSIGRPRPGVDAEIRDEDGERVPDGEIGELWLRSPAVMSGYWNDPAGTAETLVDGWLRTGDLAVCDPASGVFRLRGRVKEMFIRGGYNVYPMEVEAVLLDHPAVAAIAVVPRPDDVMGEVGVAVVVPTDPADPPTLDDLRALAAETLAHHKLPEAIRIVGELPRNASDKVDRRRLAAIEAALARYEQGVVAFRAGDNERCRRLTTESLELGRQLDDEETVGRALTGLCRAALRDVDGTAIGELTAALDELATAGGDDWWRVVSFHMRAELARMIGELDTASDLYGESLRLSEQLGSDNMVAAECFNTSLVRIEQGRLDEARRLLGRHFTIRAAHDGDDLDPTGLIAVAVLLAAEDRLGEALGVAEVCRAVFAARGEIPDPADAAPLEGVEALGAGTRPVAQPPTVAGIARDHGLLAGD